MSLNQPGNNIDLIRREVSNNTSPDKKSKLGQYMTPSAIANFMASMFVLPKEKEIKLLDAGAGIGSLTVAFLKRFLESKHHLKKIHVVAYELDSALSEFLKKIIEEYRNDKNVEVISTIHHQDFIEHAIDSIQFKLQSFTHIILNPPYKKIQNDSRHRKLLRAVNVETVNLYTAFLSLAILLLEEKGELVAIIPRSFCNGPYYKPFRKLLLQTTNIKQIHIFESRTKLFKEEGVLQENIIIYLCKESQSKRVTISYSSDSNFSDFKKRLINFEEIIHLNDSEFFIHIPASNRDEQIKTIAKSFCYNLEDLGIEVSTGPVVDFRIKEFLLRNFEPNAVPLLYPCHFEDFILKWPKPNGKKANALTFNDLTKKWLYPNGFYTIVKRFSSKEEVKRVKAFICQPHHINHTWIGFENHLNILHKRKTGLEEEIAFGLMVYLNSSLVDKLFRQFNGHTQVNATDLRLIKYPSLKTLHMIGSWAKARGHLNQEIIDGFVKRAHEEF